MEDTVVWSLHPPGKRTVGESWPEFDSPIFLHTYKMKKTIALFVNQPKCSIECGNAVMNILQDRYRFKIFTKHRVEDNFFDDVDLVIFPGGTGDAESFFTLLKQNKELIYKFLENGGAYLGICMGAYWADKRYFNLLDDIRAVQYITRPNADARRPHAKMLPIEWDGEPYDMYFYDGCAFTGNFKGTEIIATYANGDPMAIIKDNIGLIGCHPESEIGWLNKPYLLRKWHKGQHYKLLSDFVDRLLD